MRRRIIGDIHGNDDGLIAAVGLTEDEEVISVGSRVARGAGWLGEQGGTGAGRCRCAHVLPDPQARPGR